MINLAEARRLAQEYLDHLDTGAESSRVVIVGEQQFSEGWVFFYDSRRRQETGDWRDALGGNAPLIVNRETSEIVVTGTVRPVEDYLTEYAEDCRRRRIGND